MKDSSIPYDILSMKNMLITAKTQTNITKFVLSNHPPRKKKYIRRNNKSFMTKTYSRATTQKTRFRNKFLKNPTKENKSIYNKQGNFCVSSERGRKGIF